MDYSKTLHLPQTEFPMRGNLPKKEPEFVDFWQKNDLYEKRVEKRQHDGAPTFVLHDGPPYAGILTAFRSNTQSSRTPVKTAPT